MAASLQTRNRRIAIGAFVMVSVMVGASFAAVPLYEVFCRVTGYGGTTQVANAGPGEVLDRRMVIRFNADVDAHLPWKFTPVQRRMDVQVGEQNLAFYHAKNLSKETITGTASFNVTPLKAGLYFSKIACFCFTEQKLEPGAEVDMPVTFFVDPEIMNDPNLDDVKTITLSYTFFKTEAESEREPQSAKASTGN